MKELQKWFKKQRLLKKYKLTDKKMLNQIHLHEIMKDDMDFRRYHSHRVMCELRCYNRLKSL